MKSERAPKKNGYGWGGGRKEGGNNDPEKRSRKRWGGRARLNSDNKRQSLGVEWVMPKVGISPPHNLYNTYALVVSIKKKHKMGSS